MQTDWVWKRSTLASNGAASATLHGSLTTGKDFAVEGWVIVGILIAAYGFQPKGLTESSRWSGAGLTIGGEQNCISERRQKALALRTGCGKLLTKTR